MDLFNDIEFTEGEGKNPYPSAKRTKAKQGFNPLHLIENKFGLLEQFILAMQTRDKDALMLLMSDYTDSKFWKSKEDFIDSYLQTCNKIESKGPIFITILKGKCLADTDGKFNFSKLGSQMGLAVSVNSVRNNKQQWNFNLLYCREHRRKVIVKRCTRFEVDVNELS